MTLPSAEEFADELRLTVELDSFADKYIEYYAAALARIAELEATLSNWRHSSLENGMEADAIHASLQATVAERDAALASLAEWTEIGARVLKAWNPADQWDQELWDESHADLCRLAERTAATAPLL